MPPVQTVRTATVLVAGALLTGCAPPETPDYSDTDVSYPDDSPKIISVTPESGTENVNRRPIIRISFDRSIDAASLDAGTVRLYSGPSGHWLTSYYNPFKRQVVVWPGGFLLRQSTWVTELRSGLLGTNGQPVKPEVVTEFRTGDDVLFDTPYTLRSFTDEIMPIFENRCTSCHGGSDALAGLRLDTESGISETAISQPALGRPNWDIITPTQPGRSYLLYKLIGDDDVPGERMPRTLDEDETAEPLLDGEKEALLDWITTGAVFFDPEASDK